MIVRRSLIVIVIVRRFVTVIVPVLADVRWHMFVIVRLLVIVWVVGTVVVIVWVVGTVVVIVWVAVFVSVRRRVAGTVFVTMVVRRRLAGTVIRLVPAGNVWRRGRCRCGQPARHGAGPDQCTDWVGGLAGQASGVRLSTGAMRVPAGTMRVPARAMYMSGARRPQQREADASQQDPTDQSQPGVDLLWRSQGGH